MPSLTGSHALTPGPLSGITVLEFGQALSGPYCAMLLGDLGATVIKVEPPAGDMMRRSGPFADGDSLFFTVLNRNKKSVALNLKDPRTEPIIRRLFTASDVVVENFRPGVAARLKIAYADAREVNPCIVYLSISGYGSSGPNSAWGGFDQVAQGLSGLMSVTGTVEPTRVGVPIGDVLAGTYGAVGILSAMRRRSVTGDGEQVETSLLAGLVASMGVLGERYLATGEVAGLAGNDHPVLYPYGAFHASDGMFNVAVAHDELWRGLCRAIGRPALGDDARFATNDLRVEHRELLKSLLNEEFRKHTRATWTVTLNEHGVPAGPIRSLDEVFSDPQVTAQRLIEELPARSGEVRRTLGSPLQFSGGSFPVRTIAPDLGAHTDDVLLAVGYPRTAIEEFHSTGLAGPARPCS